MVKVTTLKTQDGRKMLAIGVIVGVLVAAPLGINAYANETDTDQAPTQTTESPENTTPTDTETTTDTTPEDTTLVEQTPEPENVPTAPEETDDTITQPTVADLQAAIAIAAPEHPGVEVVSAKVKRLGAETVYKVVFADGWVVYVSADDGEVLVVQDQRGTKHNCGNYAKKSWLKKHGRWDPWGNNWRAWSNAWVQQQNWSAKQRNWQWQPTSQDQQSQTSPQTKPQKHKSQAGQRQTNGASTDSNTETRSSSSRASSKKTWDVSHRSHNDQSHDRR